MLCGFQWILGMNRKACKTYLRDGWKGSGTGDETVGALGVFVGTEGKDKEFAWFDQRRIYKVWPSEKRTSLEGTGDGSQLTDQGRTGGPESTLSWLTLSRKN